MTTETEFQIFCENIRRLRKQYALSKKEMAKRLGIGMRSLEKIERGDIPVRLGCQIIFNASRCFGIRPAALFERMVSFEH